MLEKLNQNIVLEDITNDEYKTRDLGEASSFFATGISLKRIERINTICFFVFSELDKCKELSIAYWSGHLQVDARSFNHANAILKSRMFTS